MAKIENAVPALPGWETVELIGRGSFGAVYEIRKTVLGGTERCALKHISIPRDESEILELRLEGQDGESITRTFTRQAESIVSEYRLMAQLNNCPNVVSSYDVEAVQKEGGYGWDILIRMELLTPLKSYLVQQQDYPETEILRLGREIANALVACGRRRILHRDIKPENIMVAADGTYKLGDFGIVRISEKTGTATSQIGTYAYMAPEVYNGRHYGAGADLYSLGMMLYWLLNGRRGPFVSVNTAEEKETALRRRMSGEPIPAPLHGSPELKRIVLKCCAFDPAERFQSPEELINALEQAEKNTEFGNRNSELRQEQTPAPVGTTIGRPPAAPGAGTAQDPTVGVFGTSAPAGAIHESPAASKRETLDATLGAEQSLERRTLPARRDAPGGPKPANDRNGLSKTPTPTGEIPGGKDRTTPQLKDPSSKTDKKKLLPICLTAVAVLALIIFLLPKGNKAATEPTIVPIAEETLKPIPEVTPEPTAEPTPEPTPIPEPPRNRNEEVTGDYWWIEDGVLTIRGNGNIPDFKNPYEQPWSELQDEITRVVIEEGITGIGEFAFADCESLTTVEFPLSVTSIGDYAFSSCYSLNTIIIPLGVTYIGEGAFNASGLTGVVEIPSGVAYIGDGAFGWCYKLNEILVDQDNKWFASSNGVLFNKEKTELFCYPAGKNEKNYTIPNGVRSIGVYAFVYCDSLTTIKIPSSVTRIGNFAFGDCNHLTTISYGGTSAQWEALVAGTDLGLGAFATIKYD